MTKPHTTGTAGAARTAAARVAALTFAGAAIAGAAACRTAPRDDAPAAPAPSAGAAPAPAPRPDAAGRRHTDADARFMARMIGHHAQALEMTALVGERSRRDDLALLAERIAVSQRDEIAMMERWLRARGEAVPPRDTHGGHAGHAAHGAAPGDAAAMPGMLTADEMAALGRATGPAFDRLFLQLMIRHHEGALAMVAELLASPGAAQESETYRFATDVDADQRAEIRRLRALERSIPDAPAGARPFTSPSLALPT